LSWSNPIGVYKTELLAAYSGIDERVKRLVQFVKYWAKVRKLSNTRQGGMGSFAWSLTCIYFLMSVALPPILPNLQKTNVTPAYFQGFNVAFSKDMAGSYRSGNEKV
jgi:terminal uridylyltransferase